MPQEVNNQAHAAAHLERARANLQANLQQPPPEGHILADPFDAHPLAVAFDPTVFANRDLRPPPNPPMGLMAQGLIPARAPGRRPGPQNFAPPALERQGMLTPEGVETHRYGADRATRLAVAAMVRRFPVKGDHAEDLLDEVVEFIDLHFDAVDRPAARRTLIGASYPGEDFKSIADSLNKYIVRHAQTDETISTLDAAMSFWHGTASMEKSEQHAARMLFCAALVQGQQNGKHVCASGQMQLIAAHLQTAFANVYHISAPPPEPSFIAARVVAFIEHHAVHHVVPADKFDVVRARADRAMRDFVARDEELARGGFLPDEKRAERTQALGALLVANVQGIYGIAWQPPASPCTPT